MNDYEYLFKFIMIGDSSTFFLMQTLARAAYFYDSCRVALKISMSLP
jgi:hypothetical protein